MHLFGRHAPTDMDAAAAQVPVIDFGPCFAAEAGALSILLAIPANSQAPFEATTATAYLPLSNRRSAFSMSES